MKRFLWAITALAGVIAVLTGFYVLTGESLKMISGLCIGAGSAAVGLGLGGLIRTFLISASEDEEILRAKEIEMKDERNTRIREKAGYMTARIMNYALLAFVLILGFIGADKVILLSACALIVLEAVLVIVFSNYYAKKM